MRTQTIFTQIGKKTIDSLNRADNIWTYSAKDQSFALQRVDNIKDNLGTGIFKGVSIFLQEGMSGNSVCILNAPSTYSVLAYQNELPDPEEDSFNANTLNYSNINNYKEVSVKKLKEGDYILKHTLLNGKSSFNALKVSKIEKNNDEIMGIKKINEKNFENSFFVLDDFYIKI